MNMKIKNRLFVLGAAMAVMSSSAFAVTTGTQTFTAKIDNSTCVITGADITHDFGSIMKKDLLAKGDWGVIKSFDNKISVTGCPSNNTAVNVALSYAEVPGMGQYGWVNNSGTAKGLGVKLVRVRQNGYGYAPGASGYDFPLTNEAVDVPVGIDIARVARSIVPDADVADGTAKFNAIFTITVK